MNFKQILISEVSRKSLELSSLSEEKWITLFHVMNNFDEINYLALNFQEACSTREKAFGIAF